MTRMIKEILLDKFSFYKEYIIYIRFSVSIKYFSYILDILCSFNIKIYIIFNSEFHYKQVLKTQDFFIKA